MFKKIVCIPLLVCTMALSTACGKSSSSATSTGNVAMDAEQMKALANDYPGVEISQNETTGNITFRPAKSDISVFGIGNYVTVDPSVYVYNVDKPGTNALFSVTFMYKGKQVLDMTQIEVTGGERTLKKTFKSADVNARETSQGFYESIVLHLSDDDLALWQEIFQNDDIVITATGKTAYLNSPVIDLSKANNLTLLDIFNTLTQPQAE